ncbi:MAG: hypothetical protein WBN18_06625 [Flavobacteriaceae bacterium]
MKIVSLSLYTWLVKLLIAGYATYHSPLRFKRIQKTTPKTVHEKKTG